MGDDLAQEKHIRQSGGQIVFLGGVICFRGAGDQSQGLVHSGPEMHPQFKSGGRTLQFQSDPQGISSAFGAWLLPQLREGPSWTTVGAWSTGWPPELCTVDNRS